MDQKPSRFILERERKDLELYLENAEKEPALSKFKVDKMDKNSELKDNDFIRNKRDRLNEVKLQLKEYYDIS